MTLINVKSNRAGGKVLTATIKPRNVPNALMVMVGQNGHFMVGFTNYHFDHATTVILKFWPWFGKDL